MKATVILSSPDPPELFCVVCRKWKSRPLAEVLKVGLRAWVCWTCEVTTGAKTQKA